MLNLLMPSAKAQASCCFAEPPLESDYLGTSWPQGKFVAVMAQAEFGEEARVEIDAGIRSWNLSNLDSCSQVFFGEATLESFQQNDPIPNYMIRVLKVSPNNGSIAGAVVRKGVNGRAINADILIHPDYSVSGLKYIGAHETGHSNGLRNCNSCPLGTSIMTNYNES